MDETITNRALVLGGGGLAGIAASPKALGVDVLDPASMPAAAEAGRVQGRSVAAEVARAWESAPA